MKKIFAFMLAAVLCLSVFGCAKPETGGATAINLLTTGWNNTPTDANDPYRKWIADEYGLDVTLTATVDFNNAATIAFASNSKPDLVSFPNLTQFGKMRSQGVLLDDWTPFLDKMPNVKAFMARPEQQFLKGLFDENGKLTAIWTNPNSTTWSLKIREDWANEYRRTTTGGVTDDGVPYPAGNVATNGGPWQPETSTDLLNFARWIKMNKNSNPANPDYFGFSTCGGGNSFGVLGTWFPLMWGYNYLPPYGFYVDETTNKANFGVTDGSFAKQLNYMRTVCDENLIDPNWFTQVQNDDVRTKAGKIGISWYPGMITEMTANYNAGVDTSDWWETYDVPIGEGADFDGPTKPGRMINDNLASTIISVSARTALSVEKMDKICKLLDDLVCYVDDTKTGPDKYVRGKAYDALRWGVGVDADLAFQQVEGTDFKYVCVKTGNTYRESLAGVGSWDWGAWFSTTNDGVVSGESKTIGTMAKKAVDFNVRSGQYESKVQVGSFLTLDQTKINNMNIGLVDYQYKYVTRATGVMSIADFVNHWKTNLYGTELTDAATAQFKELGFIKE